MSCLRKRKRKTGYVWIVDYYDNKGQRHWFNTNTASRKVAEQMKAKIDVDLAMGALDLPVNRESVSLSKLKEIFLKYSKAEHEKSTYELNLRFIDYFMDFTSDVPLDKITRKDADDYKIHRASKVSKTSVNMEIRHLKAVFSYALEVGGLIKENPFRSVKQFKISGNNLPEFLSLSEIEVLKGAIDDQNFQDLVMFYLYTGCRRVEALKLEWQNIDLHRKRIRLIDTKGDKDREVPIKDDLFEILKRKKGNGEKLFSYSEDFVTHKLKKYIRKAGLSESFTVHSLRHTFASHLVMSGTDLYAVKKLLGHLSIKVTEMYAHLAPDYLTLGVSRLPY